MVNRRAGLDINTNMLMKSIQSFVSKLSMRGKFCRKCRRKCLDDGRAGIESIIQRKLRDLFGAESKT